VLEKLMIRFILLILCLVLSFVLVIIISSAWVFFSLVVLGYGDSGPDWLIEFEKWFEKILIIISIITGLIVSQLIYHRAFRKGKD